MAGQLHNKPDFVKAGQRGRVWHDVSQTRINATASATKV